MAERMGSDARQRFRYERAMGMLPEVTRHLRAARDAYADRARALADLQAYKRKLVMAGGAFPNQNRMAAYDDKAKTSQERLKLAVDTLTDWGVEIKDVERGLVDFPSRYEGREVCLCYELGEDGIAFWHGAEEGFAGRKPIDAEFLEKHEGE
jgi:hypothetical protein